MRSLSSRIALVSLLLSAVGLVPVAANAAGMFSLDGVQAHTVFHLRNAAASATPTGLSPAQIKTVYNLPASGGGGTIAIVDAYNDPTIASDLNAFDQKYGLATCTTANGCFTEHEMATRVSNDSGWAVEMSLDTEWAHAVAPTSKILLVEAKSSSLTDLLSAIDYARSQSGVVAVSMSWGASEFNGETQYDTHFTSTSGIGFFASSGDNGHGVLWPAAAANVTGVGGTSLSFSAAGALVSETAWSGSGGGLSNYESEPIYQVQLGIPKDTTAKRAVPDVSYDANPNSGFSVYDSTRYNGQSGWFEVGGTSAGAPQWAAIKALGGTATNVAIYHDAASTLSSTYLRDVLSGTNGYCANYCTASTGYDYVTGLGSPLTTTF